MATKKKVIKKKVIKKKVVKKKVIKKKTIKKAVKKTVKVTKKKAVKKAIKHAAKKKDEAVIIHNPSTKENSKPLSVFCCELIVTGKYTSSEISEKLVEAYPDKKATDVRIVYHYKSAIRAGRMKRLGFESDDIPKSNVVSEPIESNESNVAKRKIATRKNKD